MCIQIYVTREPVNGLSIFIALRIYILYGGICNAPSTFAKSVGFSILTCLRLILQHSDGEKSDQDLVVDDASEDPISPPNGTVSPRENGIDKLPKKEHAGPHSPR